MHRTHPVRKQITVRVCWGITDDVLVDHIDVFSIDPRCVDVDVDIMGKHFERF